jgi:hypothetical protein
MSKENKFLLTAGIVFALLISVTASAYVYQRASYTSKYTVVATQQQEEDVAAVITVATTTTFGMLLVDVSNVNMFPHPWSGEVRLSKIEIAWQSDASYMASTTLKFGVVASTTISGAVQDISYFDTVYFANDTEIDNPQQRVVLDYGLSTMKLGLNGATTTGFITNDKDTSSTLFATSSTMAISPRGAYTSYPGLGDLVVRLSRQNNLSNITIRAFYHVK